MRVVPPRPDLECECFENAADEAVSAERSVIYERLLVMAAIASAVREVKRFPVVSLPRIHQGKRRLRAFRCFLFMTILFFQPFFCIVMLRGTQRSSVYR